MLARRDLHYHCLGFCKELAAEVAALPADARIAGSAKGCPEVADEKAVDPHGSRAQSRSYAVCTAQVFGEEHGVEPVAGVVGERHRLRLGFERNNRRKGPEYFFDGD